MTNTALFAALKVASVQWTLAPMMSETTTRGGEVIRTGIGARLWRGSVSLWQQYHRDIAEIEALLAELEQPGQAILAFDPRYTGPRLDPTGTILGSATPTIHTLNADNRRLRIQGLPSNYVLSVGDYLGFTYGSNPTRYALHRITTAATATGAGLTPLFAVTPHIRPGAAVGAAVSLLRPSCKCLLRVEYGTGSRIFTRDTQITLIQTLR